MASRSPGTKKAASRMPIAAKTVRSKAMVIQPSGLGATAEWMLPPGTIVGGRYRLEALVNHGGMGAIYTAVDQRLGRPVAVKMMLDDQARQPGAIERFEREAKITAGIKHPNCIVAHDYGMDERGCYLVLEWLEGRTLEALVAEAGPLAPERGMSLMAQLCDVLEATHALGYVHRDVKPQNIMVSTTPEGGELVRLLDFGVAQALDGSDAHPTVPGTLIGSPLFMSPEQALAKPVGVTSDMYSVGATLYFALSGRPPYLGADIATLLQQVINAEPPDLPEALCHHSVSKLLKRAMAKHHGERPQSAADLARMLREAAASPAPARPAGAARRRSMAQARHVQPGGRYDTPPQADNAPPVMRSRRDIRAMNVKGTAYRARETPVIEELGKLNWGGFIEEWWKAHPAFPDRVLPVSKLPVEPFLEMQDALVQELHGGDSKALWHIGVKSGDLALTRGELKDLFTSDDVRRFLLFWTAHLPALLRRRRPHRDAGR